MKMGVERILRENFPYLKKVEAIPPKPIELLSIELIETSLEVVKSRINAMGGSFTVESVNQHTNEVIIGFKGPNKLKQGIELILKDMKMIKNIKFNDIL